MKNIILASESYRLEGVLNAKKLPYRIFEVNTTDITSRLTTSPSSEEYVQDIAFKKADKISENNRQGISLSSHSQLFIDGMEINPYSHNSGPTDFLSRIIDKNFMIRTGYCLIHPQEGRTIRHTDDLQAQLSEAQRQEILNILESQNNINSENGFQKYLMNPILRIINNQSEISGLEKNEFMYKLLEYDELTKSSSEDPTNLRHNKAVLENNSSTNESISRSFNVSSIAINNHDNNEISNDLSKKEVNNESQISAAIGNRSSDNHQDIGMERVKNYQDGSRDTDDQTLKDEKSQDRPTKLIKHSDNEESSQKRESSRVSADSSTQVLDSKKRRRSKRNYDDESDEDGIFSAFFRIITFVPVDDVVFWFVIALIFGVIAFVLMFSSIGLIEAI